MDIALSSRRKALAIRQWTVQRKNLVNVCRLAVKSLIDMASLDIIDDDCEELINLLAILEQILMHRLRPHKTWYGSEGTRPFWDYIRVACQGVPHNCIDSINAIENIRSPHAKGQAWLRVVLMEKRLSEYLSEALKQTRITKNYYQEGAVMLSDDAKMLCDTLLGMNAIDFSFCLKGENIELLGPIAVDYTPYLQYFQSSDSIEADLRDLSNSNSSSSLMNEENLNEESWRIKYCKLEANYKIIHEQKGYFEELVRLREDQLHEIHKQYEKLVETLHSMESDGIRERRQLESVIIELQGQLSAMKDYSHSLQQELLFLMSRQQMMPLAPALETLPTPKERPARIQQVDSEPSSYVSPDSTPGLGQSSRRHSSGISSQSSLTVPMYKIQKKEDSQSLVPLAGSFSSEASMKLTDTPMSAPSGTSQALDSDSDLPSSAASEMTRQHHQAQMLRSPKHVTKVDGDEGENVTNIIVSSPTASRPARGSLHDIARPDLVAFCDPADNGNSEVISPERKASDNGNEVPEHSYEMMELERSVPLDQLAANPKQEQADSSAKSEKDAVGILEPNNGHSDSETGSSSWSDVGLVHDSGDSDCNGGSSTKQNSLENVSDSQAS